MNAFVVYNLFITHDGGVQLNAFPEDTKSELADIVFTLSFLLSAKQEAANTIF